MLKTLLASNKQLALMLIKAQKEVFSHVIGENNSKTHGSGYDFVELREYQSGDDSKNIDWIISSKIGKPHVKVFHQQRELNVSIATILSGSVHFGTKILKHDLINEVSALIAYGCLKQNDPFESYICNDDVILNTKKTKKLFTVRTLSENIANYDVIGKCVNWEIISKKLFIQIKQKSLLFIIGDFFHIETLDLKVLSIKHEIILIIIRDKFEEKPSNLGAMNIVDPVNQQSSFAKLNSSDIKKIELKVIENDRLLYSKLKKLGIDFIKIYTDEKPAKKILSLMMNR